MVQGVNPFLFCICICVAVCVLVFVQLYPSWAEQSVFGEVSCALLIHSSCGAAEPDSLLLGRAPPLLCAEHSSNGRLPMATNSSNVSLQLGTMGTIGYSRMLPSGTDGLIYLPRVLRIFTASAMGYYGLLFCALALVA